MRGTRLESVYGKEEWNGGREGRGAEEAAGPGSSLSRKLRPVRMAPLPQLRDLSSAPSWPVAQSPGGWPPARSLRPSHTAT